MGTLVNGQYQWKNFKECVDTAKYFASGCQALGLNPEVEGEGKSWRFIGIQAKNREGWALAHWGNMHTGTASVALYDTLGVDAFKFVVNQTEMVTIVCSGDIVKNIIQRKVDDLTAGPNRKLHRLKYVVSFDPVSDEEKQNAANVEI